MGIIGSVKKVFKGDNIRVGCDFDERTGKAHCEARRITQDGEEVIGESNVMVNQRCNMVPDGEVWELEGSGALELINKEILSTVKSKCRAKLGEVPSDY